MATSSMTANFYTDDPKVANKIVALFSRTRSWHNEFVQMFAVVNDESPAGGPGS